MNLRDMLEGVVLKSKLPVGLRRAVLLVSVESEEDLGRVAAEARKVRRLEWLRAYRARNREKLAAQTKAWRQANPDKVRAARNRWRKANPVTWRNMQRKAAARRYHANPERFREEARAYRRKFAERVRASNTASYTRHREELNARHRAWYAKNKDRVNAARRAKARA